MKILYFYQYFTTPQGSYSTRVYEMARRWVEAGDSVTVVTTVYDKSDIRASKFISRLEIDGVDVRVVNIAMSNKHGKARRLVGYLAYAFMCCWYALTLPCDVVISSSPPITVALPGLLTHYFRRKPLFFEIRDLWPEVLIDMGVVRNPLLIWCARVFEKFCYRSSRKVIALSEGIAEWIHKLYGYTNLEIVSNASDNRLIECLKGGFELPEWARGKHLVIYSGAMGYANEVGQILDTASELKKKDTSGDIVIVLAGGGQDQAMLERRVRDEVLTNVRFLGYIPKEQVLRWIRLSACSLLVFRNSIVMASGSPNKLFDAFSAGVPVIHNTQGWIKRFVDRERCGISVAPGAPLVMADAILQLIQDPGLHSEMGRNSRRVAHEFFDRDTLALKMRRILMANLQDQAQGSDRATTGQSNPLCLTDQPRVSSGRSGSCRHD
jgi:glycosyltransferase involved in cell wall biosynthesis